VTLQPGFLGGRGGAPLASHVATLAQGQRWCSLHPLCVGFSTHAAAYTQMRSSGALPLTFHSSSKLALSPHWVSYIVDGASLRGRYLQQPGYLVTEGLDESSGSTRLLHEGDYDVDEAREWCDRRVECAGFTFSVDVAPSTISSRTDAANARAWIRFSSSRAIFYAQLNGATAINGGWVSYTKDAGHIVGQAANIGASPHGPISWLQQPGFIIAPEASLDEMHAGTSQLIRVDEHATLHDVLRWCGASIECEGFTHAQPSAGVPTDRLQTACYCCRVDVRTNRAQVSWTKWSPPSRRLRQRLDETLRAADEAARSRQQIGQGPPLPAAASYLTPGARGHGLSSGPSAAPGLVIRSATADGREAEALTHTCTCTCTYT